MAAYAASTRRFLTTVAAWRDGRPFYMRIGVATLPKDRRRRCRRQCRRRILTIFHFEAAMTKKPEPVASNRSSLTDFLERVERLEEERKAINEDISEVWKEAKAQGFDVKAAKKAHALRKLDVELRRKVGEYADELDLFR
jgi:uncharacterized protein (UPF0335 family)